MIRFHDIFAQCPRPVDTATPARFAFAACAPQLARNARTYEITMANGTKIRRTSDDPGRALLTGVVGGPAPLDDWEKLETPGLHGISRTAPYFHNNSAATLEEVVDHYIEFFKRVQVTATVVGAPPIASTDGVHFDRMPTPDERAHSWPICESCNAGTASKSFIRRSPFRSSSDGASRSTGTFLPH